MADGKRVVLFDAVDCCIRFTRKNQHCGDRERSRPQGPKNGNNNFNDSAGCELNMRHVTEMLLILKKST